MKKLGNVYILGDSYSTFKGYIPQTHGAYYKTIIQEDTDVCEVDQTWWKIVLNNTESNLVLNDSWSGTTICHTGYNAGDASNRSFVTRFDKLTDEGFFRENEIDTVFIFGGTNDNWANSPLGEPQYSDWTKEDLFNVLPAINYLFKRVRETLPNTRIITIINEGFKEKIKSELIAASEKFGFECLVLEHFDKRGGHPCITGMAQIAEQVLNFI